MYTLTDDNFDTALEKFDILFVKFYARKFEIIFNNFVKAWCGHCKELSPEFNKAAQIIKSKKINVAFGDIDATV